MKILVQCVGRNGPEPFPGLEMRMKEKQGIGCGHQLLRVLVLSAFANVFLKFLYKNVVSPFSFIAYTPYTIMIIIKLSFFSSRIVGRAADFCDTKEKGFSSSQKIYLSILVLFSP